MGWKFWQKGKADETVIKVTKSRHGTEVYVSAQTRDKALSLYRELDKELKE